MPPIMSEAFARGLVNKIMTEAFDVLEITTQNDTLVAHHEAEDPTNPTESSRTNEQMRTDNDGLLRPMEILLDFSEIQIGEPSPTLHRQITVLEEQVKQTVCSINDLCETIGSTGTHVVRGQGDVYETMPQTVVEGQPIPVESVTPVKDKEPEVTGGSEDLLHQMIQELESTSHEPTITDNNEEQCSNEKVSEEEKKIEESISVDDEILKKDTIETNPVEVECASHSYELDEPKISTTMLPSTSFARHASLEEVPITETMSDSPGRGATLNTVGLISADEIRETPSLSEIKHKSKRLKKINFFGRLRRLIRTTFGRRKD